MTSRPSFPTYAEIRDRQLTAHRARALSAARAGAVAARAACARLLVFGSLVEGRFHRGSDLDVALEGPATGLADLALTVERIAAAHGIAADVVRLDQAPPRLAARIRERGRDPAELE